MKSAYRRLRHRTYEILKDHGNSQWSHRVALFLMSIIMLSVFIVILASVQEIHDEYVGVIWRIDVVVMTIFVLEYVLRLWYRHPVLGRLRYFFTPMALIDLVAILPTLLTGLGVNLASLRIARLLRLARALKFVRYVEAIHLIGRVVRAKGHQLGTSLLFVSFILVITSTLMYEFENAVQPEAFSSIPATMWWSVATLTTVGYGDVYPITPVGKILAAISAVLGIGLFAIPTGILASGFSELALEQRERQEEEAAAESRCPHCGKIM
jgi:voltage-gated potassium channel